MGPTAIVTPRQYAHGRHDMAESPGTAAWLAAFHAGDRSTIERCYRDHCGLVLRVTCARLSPADAETVTHEVFYRLLTNARARGSFRGGNFEAWLTQVATNAAVDHLRRYRRETSPEAGPAPHTEGHSGEYQEAVEAKVLVERFRRERLPPELAPVFEARFLRQLPQRQAASELGVPRTTLVYQEQRIRALIRSFLLGEGPS